MLLFLSARYRDDFLAKIKKAMIPSSSEVKDNPFNWVLLDEDGEEVGILYITLPEAPAGSCILLVSSFFFLFFWQHF